MNIEKSIFGCFVSVTHPNPNSPQTEKDLATEQANLFRTYIWGEKGLSDKLKKLNNEDYGNDLVLALFQFYVNPIQYEVETLKEIEPYRKREKSIGIPIIVNDKNFFNQSEQGRSDFFRETILQKMDLLKEVVKNKKLDTNMDLLTSDIKKVLEVS